MKKLITILAALTILSCNTKPTEEVKPLIDTNIIAVDTIVLKADSLSVDTIKK